MPNETQVETLFSGLQESSIIQRFGPTNTQPQETHSSRMNQRAEQRIERETKQQLKQQGFSITGENRAWVGFRRGHTEYIQQVWEDLDVAELEAIESGRDFPQSLKDTYKICLDISPSKVPTAIELLGSQFSDLPIYGKVAKGNLLDRENFPDLVLYVRGANKSEVLDFATALGYAVKHQLGSTQTDLDAALEIVPGSGVYLTQGNYQSKLRARQLGVASRYYSPDGSLFAGEFEETLTYAARRRNQFLIEENLYLFNGLPPTQRLLNLQMAAFDGVDVDFNLGIRERDVKVEEYFAPTSEKVPSLLAKLDQRYQELLEALPEKPSYEQAVRLASFLYTTSILIHPLENGNGQSCTNLATSCLYDLGFRKIYINPFMDGRLMRCRAFGLAVTQEAPTSDRTTPRDPQLKERAMQEEREKHATGIVSTALSSSYWGAVKRYVLEGDLRAALETARDTLPPQSEYARSYITRVREISDFLRENLTEEPVGSKNLTFHEQQQAHEETLLY